ncbi:RsbRD N-terminal domain-containing protein [Desulfitobacterium sp.]|nr:RsbRD N-terminal domain-containing protein [Desulfitobacterium sp.]MEA4903063.1 RsbRD N-terminal domain-containing protein [Desulfitobacterium sp.]
MEKELRGLIEEKKPIIIQKWFDAIMDTYPADTSGFLRKQKDQFRNPVGHTITQSIDQIFTALLQDKESAEMNDFLTDLIKVRAVQEFTPSQALGFIFPLKKIIREELGVTIEERQYSKALLALYEKIDELALSSFDIYSQCREQLYELKVMEFKNMTTRLLKKANLVSELPDEEPNDKELDAKTTRKEGVK